MSVRFAYIGVPLWYGCGKKGTDSAPSAIRSGNLLENLQSMGISISDFGDIDFGTSANALEDYSEYPMYRYRDTLLAVSKIRDVVEQAQQAGNIPVVTGGDHSLELGSVSASAKQDPNIGVIWFDAHGDMNTEETSPTGHIHGMPVAALMGLCKSRLNDIPANYVKPQNIFWIGARSLDEGERKLIANLHLNVYSTDEIHRRGMCHVMAEVADKMQRLGIKNVHCSFDVDAMDPTIVAATGCLVPHGLNNQDFDEFTASLSTMVQCITALDFVEYNPLLDDAQHTSLHWCQEALQRLCNAVIQNRV